MSFHIILYYAYKKYHNNPIESNRRKIILNRICKDRNDVKKFLFWEQKTSNAYMTLLYDNGLTRCNIKCSLIMIKTLMNSFF